MDQPEAVLVQLPATSQRAPSGEEVITLDLDLSEVVPPSQNAEGLLTARRGTTRHAVKRTYASTSSNTAPDYAEAGESVSDEQYYPAYLFQNVPSKLQTENLRKMALISIIEKNKAQTNVYEMLKGCVGPLKNVLVGVASQYGIGNEGGGDHTYIANAGTSHDKNNSSSNFRCLMACHLKLRVSL